MRTITKRRLTITAAAVVCAAAVAIPTTLLARSSDGIESAPVPPVTAVDATTEQLLSVFRGPRTDADALPQPRDAVRPTGDELPGEAYELSRRTDPAGGSDPVYLWPKNDGACFSTAGISSCADAEAIARREVVFGLYSGHAIEAGAIRLAGFARDGVEQLTAVLDGGETVAVPISDNAFRVDLSEPATELRWVGPDGERSERLPAFSPDNPATQPGAGPGADASGRAG